MVTLNSIRRWMVHDEYHGKLILIEPCEYDQAYDKAKEKFPELEYRGSEYLKIHEWAEIIP